MTMAADQDELSCSRFNQVLRHLQSESAESTRDEICCVLSNRNFRSDVVSLERQHHFPDMFRLRHVSERADHMTDLKHLPGQRFQCARRDVLDQRIEHRMDQAGILLSNLQEIKG